MTTIIAEIMAEIPVAEGSKKDLILTKIKETQDHQAHLALLVLLPTLLPAVPLVHPVLPRVLQPRLDVGSGQMLLANGNGLPQGPLLLKQV